MARRRPARHHGLLAVDKPADWTSRDVVNRVGNLIGERRCGHTGTLDPAATGVLVLAFGRATKAIRWLTDGPKRYVADVRFGASTLTDDAEGEPVATAPLPADWSETRLQEAAAVGVGGLIAQVPPAVSALKQGGVRDHERVRRGEAVVREARQVWLHEARLLSLDGEHARFEVCCGPGFYVRAWARDLGRQLGTLAHLTGLRRSYTSGLGLDRCVDLDTLAAESPEARQARLLPLESALSQALPTIEVSAAHASWLEQGKRPEADPDQDGPHLLVDPTGDAVCVAEPIVRDGRRIWRVLRGLRPAEALAGTPPVPKGADSP